jgi:hypothetical protein
MLARKEEILCDSISIYTFERSSYETRVLTSIFEGFVPGGIEWGISEVNDAQEEGGDEEGGGYVIGGFIAIYIDLTKWAPEDILCSSLRP